MKKTPLTNRQQRKAAPQGSGRAKGRAKVSPSKARPLSSKGERYFGIWKNFWAFAGPVFTVLSLGNFYSPSVTITSGVNLDPKQSLQTQFLVANTGNVKVYDLSFACTFNAFVPAGASAQIGMDGNKLLVGVSELMSKHTVSRGCFTVSRTAEGTVLRVVTWFRWPLINYRDRVEAYFVVRKGADGFFLVPDSPPDPSSNMALPPVIDPPV